MALKIDNPNDFIDAISYLISKENESYTKQEYNQPYIFPAQNFKLAKVSESYTSGRPLVIFEGERAQSQKEYPHLESYTPSADDWVLMAKVGKSYVILGKII